MIALTAHKMGSDVSVDVKEFGTHGDTKKKRCAKATELNRHTTRMKIRGSVVS